MNCFVIANPDKCIGCRTCMIACVVAHNGEEMFYEKHEEVNFNPKLDVIKTETVSAPIQCRHCEDAPCAKVCPNDAIGKIDHTIKINISKCVGCKTCMVACPIGAIDLSPISNIDKDKLCFRGNMVANKCDLCIDTEDGPACAKVCPTKAFRIIKEDDINNGVKDKRKLATSI